MTLAAPPLELSPNHFSFPAGQTLNQTFYAIGGSGTGYTFSIQSGTGTINSVSGVLSIGARMPNTTTIVRVTDLNGSTDDIIISHVISIANGIVRASATDATSLYVGGAFSAIQPYITKGLMSVDETTGILKDYGIASGFNAGAIIKAVLVDGDNLYVGGMFTSYHGTSIQNLAKSVFPAENLILTSVSHWVQ